MLAGSTFWAKSFANVPPSHQSLIDCQYASSIPKAT
jgi:hypothetical protein